MPRDEGPNASSRTEKGREARDMLVELFRLRSWMYLQPLRSSRLTVVTGRALLDPVMLRSYA